MWRFIRPWREPAEHVFTRRIFLRLLGVIYLIAFASLWPQLSGLIGANGILPAGQFLQLVREQLGVRAYSLVPTLLWLCTTDGCLQLLAAGGVLLSLLVILDRAAGPALLLLWLFYLSLVSVGRDFLAFQWDILLLEAGFLAIFFAPWSIRNRGSPPSVILVWLFRWLAFRLTFLSGAVKLLSHDRSWRNLTALTFHYQTQPLPNVAAWYAHHLPAWVQKISVVMMFGAELVVPFFLLAPRTLRLTAAFLLIGFQGLIFLTGNYTFFNLLTIVLCLSALDDLAIRRIVPKLQRPSEGARTSAWRRYPFAALAVMIVSISLLQMSGMFLGYVPETAGDVMGAVAPFHLVNEYGLFAVMTTSRPEIIVEGSRDGRNWLAYEFPYKPGDLSQAPRQVAPHQPRLDWQMWFAALGSYQQQPWFVNFVIRLLEGSPQVLGLLAKNPFPGQPPRYVRAVLYDYHFTSFEERRASGNWWKREFSGIYLPPVSLK